MSEPPTWTHIHFDLKKVDLNYLRELLLNLRDKDVWFDWSVGLFPEWCEIRQDDIPTPQTMEWQTDWALKGPMDIADICAFLDKKSVEYTLVKVLNHRGE